MRSATTFLLAVSLVALRSRADGDEPNAAPSVEWIRTFGGTTHAVANSVVETTDGDYVVAGARGSELLLARVGASGDILWERTPGAGINDFGYSVTETADGGFIVAGAAAHPAQVKFDVYLLKTDARGTAQWESTIDTGSDEKALSVRQTADISSPARPSRAGSASATFTW